MTGVSHRQAPARAAVVRALASIGMRLAPAACLLALAAHDVRAQERAPTPPAPGAHGAASGTEGMSLDRVVRVFLLADQLEYAPAGDEPGVRVEGLGWIGGDYNRLWLRLEGDQPTTAGKSGHTWQADVAYGRLISPFWNALVGARVDTRQWAGERMTRGLVGVGLEGLGPYWIELEPMLYVSQDGDVSARIAGAFDVLFTQRLILQPRLEVNAAVQAVPEIGVGRGLNDIELGARARYEFSRRFAPYVGVNWHRRTGATAGMARAVGESDGDFSVVAGLRAWR